MLWIVYNLKVVMSRGSRGISIYPHIRISEANKQVDFILVAMSPPLAVCVCCIIDRVIGDLIKFWL